MKKEAISSFEEECGIRLLESFLEESKQIKTHFLRNDKTPIFDGFFNLLNDRKEILKSFDAQIKTSESIRFLQKGPNKDKYSFTFDRDVLDAVRYKVTENPTFYFIIDPSRKIIICKLLTKEFLMSLKYFNSTNKNIRYYFSKDDILSDFECFYNNLIEIRKNSLMQNCFKTKKDIENIQRYMNDFYGKLEKLSFIKNKIFPNLYKFGIRNSSSFLKLTSLNNDFKISGGCNAYALYPIYYGSQQNEITDFYDSPDNMLINFDLTGDVSISKYLNNALSEFVNTYFDTPYCIESLPTICLIETIFHYLFKISYFSELNGPYIQIPDQLMVSNASSLLKPFYDCFISIMKKKVIDVSLQQSKYFIGYIAQGKIAIDKKKMEDILICNLAIKEIQKRKIETISRPWNYMVNRQNWNGGWQRDKFDKSKYSKSLEYFFNNLNFVVDEFLKNIPYISDFKLKGEWYYCIEENETPYPCRWLTYWLVDANKDWTFKESSEKSNGIYEFMVSTGQLDDIFDTEMPFNIVCREILLELICKDFNLESRGISNKYQKFKIGLLED